MSRQSLSVDSDQALLVPWRTADPRRGLKMFDAIMYWGREAEARTLAVLMDMHGKDVWYQTIELGEEEQAALNSAFTYLKQELHSRLLAGELVATGYDSRAALDSPPIRITPDRWRVLTPNVLASQAFDEGVRIKGILIFEVDVEAITGHRGRFSAARLRAWYTDWITLNEHNPKIPSRDDDWAAAKLIFGADIPREHLRDLRRELAPPHWKRFGRRKRTE